MSAPNPLRRLFGSKDDITEKPNTDPTADEAAMVKAQAYLDQVRQKMERLAEDFAAGRINTTQFQELYTHYQQERRIIEETLGEAPETAAWRAAVATGEGESTIIRRRHAARIMGYAIYLNASAALLRAVGQYDMDNRLVATMLDSLRSDTTEQAERQMRGIEIENGQWVGFVPGQYTTLAVLFTVEPARAQLETLRDLQAHFERANEPLFARGITDPAQFVFPHAAAFE
jgi:hypothetical protein